MTTGDHDHEFDDLVIDIGLAGGSSENTARPRPHQPRTPRGKGTPWRAIGVIAGVVAALSLVFGLLAGNDRSADQALPTPAPTIDPEDRVGIPDLARPAPTAVVIPVVSQGILRAGQTCALAIPGEPAGVVRFTVPDGLSATCSAGVAEFATDPVSLRTDDLLPMNVTIDELNLNQVFIGLAAGDRSPPNLRWAPIDGRRGWRWGDREAVASAFEIPGGLAMIDAELTDVSADVASRLAIAYTDLLASLDVELLEPDRFHQLPDIGGWCATERFVTKVPANWFAAPGCRFLNTSSESSVVLQCECLPPLWVERNTVAFDGDFGFASIDVDRLEELADGRTVRIIEGLRRDGNNMDRPVRAVILDAGDQRVAVMGTEFPEHALPGHTWRDTLDAQQQLVEFMRFHSGPECGEGTRWVVSNRGGPMTIEVATDTLALPPGTAVRGTGCSRGDGAELEVQVEGQPELIGWVGVDVLVEPEVTRCPSGERIFDPRDWITRAEGDFDGDGRVDTVYVREPFDVEAVAPTIPSTLAVLFADGGLTEGAIGFVDDEPVLTAEVSVVRLQGMPHDLLEVRHPLDEFVDAVELRDPATCSLATVARGTDDRAAAATGRVCAYDVPGLGLVYRSWERSPSYLPGSWITEVDDIWIGRGGALEVRPTPAGAPPCGATPPPEEPIVERGLPGTELAGTHPLTLQWVATRNGTSGAVRLEPLGFDRYRVIGSHIAPPGESLQMDGTLEIVSPDTLAFNGTIITQIERLNGGEPCVRNAGQRFVRTPGTDEFRMQDRINCDGARTDWIDITLPIQTAP